jgi:hypothetical protein
MVFSGTGMVKRRGKVIANFIDGFAAVDDPGNIEYLTVLGFRPANPYHDTPAPPQATKAAPKKKVDPVKKKAR